MTAGETILKFTDYPFAYSIVGIGLGMLGFSLSQNQIIFIGIAGAFGTLLATTDPVGSLIRRVETNHLKKKLTKDDNQVYFLYKLSALKTKAISFEIEKMIGAFYFIFSIIGFVVAIIAPTPFFNKLMLNDLLGNPIINELYLKMIYLSLAGIAIGILSLRTRRFWKEFDGQIDIAAYHMTAINNDNATQTSVENMTRAIEQNDWELAGLWKQKIDEEIEYKKGKRELIIKAADSVFSPLHMESSKFKDHLRYMKQRKQLNDFKPEQWEIIRQYSRQSIIEDTRLRFRIDTFYEVMYEYNDLSSKAFREANEIINRNFSKHFGKDVSGVDFHLETPSSGNTVHLTNCAMFEIHPLEWNSPQIKFGSFRIQTRRGNQVDYTEYTQINDFDEIWKKVLEDVRNNNLMINIQKYLTDLEVENEKLMKIYSEKIEMQWKV